MTTNLISLNVKKLSYSGLKAMAEQVVNGMTASVFYSSPQPTLIQMGLLISNYGDALTAWGDAHNHGTTAQRTALRDARKALEEGLVALQMYCCNTTPGNLFAFQSAGWPTRATANPIGKLQQVRNLHQMLSADVLTGTLKIKWNRPLNSVNVRVPLFHIMRSASSNFANAELIGTSTKQSFVDESPLTGIGYYWVIPVNAYGLGDIGDLCAASPRLIPS